MHLATFHDDGWELEDGESRHTEAPATFELPPLTERQSLKAGQIVKLIFRIALRDEPGLPSERTERMWVSVGEAQGFGYLGTLDNDAYCTPELKAGLQLSFEPRHVIQIWRES